MLLTAAILLTMAVVVYTLFVRPQDVPEAPPVSPTLHLEERKAQIYENLRDLQFEYRVGKLSDADYQQTKTDLQRELAGVLAEIDRFKQMPAPAKPKTEPVKTAGTATATICPHCEAKFSRPLRFCGECGKAMVKETA